MSKIVNRLFVQSDAHKVGDVFNFINLGCCVPCLMATVYFAFRFGKLSTFSSNLKVVMIMTSFASVFGTGLHPIVHYIPESFFRFRDGATVTGAVIFYSLNLIQRALSIYLDTKFLLITIERMRAYRLRATYETASATWAIRFTAFWVVLVFGLLGARSAYVAVTLNGDIDEKLMTAFIVTRSPVDFLVFYAVAGSSFFIAWVYINTLLREVTDNKLGGTLTESFEIRQTIVVLHVLHFLCRAFFVTVSVTGMFFTWSMYDLFFVTRSVDSEVYLAGTHCAFATASVYSLVAAFYTAWHFKQVRRQIREDFHWICGCRLPSGDSGRIEPARQHETKAYFEYFQSQGW